MTGATPTLESRDPITARIEMHHATAPRTPAEWVRSVDGRISRLSRQVRSVRRWVQLAIGLGLLTQFTDLKPADLKALLSALGGVP